MNLVDWINTSGALEVYREWQAHPVTRIMIDGIRERARMLKLHTPTGEAALQEVGYRAARDEDLMIMEKLDKYIEAGEGQLGEKQVEYLMDVEDFTRDEAEAIVSKNGG